MGNVSKDKKAEENTHSRDDIDRQSWKEERKRLTSFEDCVDTFNTTTTWRLHKKEQRSFLFNSFLVFKKLFTWEEKNENELIKKKNKKKKKNVIHH